jgi:hypothetical protein
MTSLMVMKRHSTCLVKLTHTVAGYGDLKTPIHFVSMGVIAPK